MNKREAFEIVFNYLNDCDLFMGKFDTHHMTEEQKHFMYGINTVMENIAYNVNDEVGENFSEVFMKNFKESLDKINKM